MSLSGKRVLVTGHTGFKGSWAVALFHELGAAVGGYALDPPTTPSLFDDARLAELCEADVRADVRDFERLAAVVADFRPDLVLHMAAQPIVNDGYRNPRETWEVNTQGTVNLLEAVRQASGVQGVVVVTTDKVYEPSETAAHRESDRLGGHDNYAASKAAAELAVAAYRSSYWSESGPILASARAGNVIGGGDWAADRLLADAARAALAGEPLVLRHPEAVRPWQHVLDAVSGYVILLERMLAGDRSVARAWNFGPDPDERVTVGEVVGLFNDEFGIDAAPALTDGEFEENPYLTVDAADSRALLGWAPRFTTEQAVRTTAQWYQRFGGGEDARVLMTGTVALTR